MQEDYRNECKLAFIGLHDKGLTNSVDVPPATLPGSEGAGEDGAAGARFLFRP